jgi:hypothetical protein
MYINYTQHWTEKTNFLSIFKGCGGFTCLKIHYSSTNPELRRNLENEGKEML